MNSPKEIANNYIAIGKGKVNTPVAKMFVLGILAGIFIAFGGVASTAAAVSIPLASAGAWIAGVAPLLIWGVCISLFAYFLMSKGYSLGQKSVVNILQSSALTRLINMASVLGLFMMGALSSTYVKLKSVVSWTDVAGKAVYLQDKLDAIFPNVLPLLVVFGVYFYIKKAGPKYVRILVFLIVAALLLSFLGIV